MCAKSTLYIPLVKYQAVQFAIDLVSTRCTIISSGEQSHHIVHDPMHGLLEVVPRHTTTPPSVVVVLAHACPMDYCEVRALTVDVVLVPTTSKVNRKVGTDAIKRVIDKMTHTYPGSLLIVVADDMTNQAANLLRDSTTVHSTHFTYAEAAVGRTCGHVFQVQHCAKLTQVERAAFTTRQPNFRLACFYLPVNDILARLHHARTDDILAITQTDPQCGSVERYALVTKEVSLK
jgi:hypothetical protein